MKKEFILLVKNALSKKEISLRELARRSNLDVSFLSKILNGKRNPPSSEQDIRKIAKALQVKPVKLLFAAGRIPESLQEIFNDENFIENLIALRNNALSEKVKQVEHKTPKIENKLL